MNSSTRSASIAPARRTGKVGPKLEIVPDPRPATDFDFSGMLVWEQEIYRNDPTGGDPATRF